MPSIPFHKPIMPSDLNEIYSDSLKAGWLTTGPEVKKFESRLKNMLNAEHVIAVNSCTAALHLALEAKGFSDKDKFIAPTYTFVATVEVGEYLGMECVLVDSENNGFNMNLNLLEDKLKADPNIKAIIPVHFAGESLDMISIFDLAEKYGTFILEDAAHALEANSNVGKVGDTNHAAAFSFYANKNITTGGEGGALATNDSVLAEKVRKLSLHGISKDGWKRFKMGGSWRYDISDLGFKYNMTDIAASIGNWQLNHFQKWYKRRINIVNKYIEGLKSIEGITTPSININEHACHLFVIRIVPECWSISRDDLIHKINENRIGTSVHYTPVHMHSYYQRKYGFQPGDYPIAKQLSEQVITLPLYPLLKNNEIDYIISTLYDLWNKYKI